jgi:large subunit ribosomal protein L29
MKAAHLREKTAEELGELRKSLAHDVFENRLKNFTNRLDDTSAIRKTRRDVARVATLQRQRQIAAAKDAAPKAAPAAAPAAAAASVAAAPAAAAATKAASKKSAKKAEKGGAKS